MRTVFSALLLLALSSSAECAGLTVRRPSTAVRTTASRGYTPHFPNTQTRTITQGKNIYIHPARPQSR